MDRIWDERGLNRNGLKYIAAATMLFDHIGALLFPLSGGFYIMCRLFGRLTAPIMCYFLAEGFIHTSSRKRYALRLLVFAILSQPVYALVHGWSVFVPGGLSNANLNVLFTLLASFCMLTVLEEIKQPLLKWTVAVLLIALSACGDWGVTAPLWVLFFYLFHGDRRRQMAAFALVAAADILCIIIANLLEGLAWYLNMWETGLFLFIPLMLFYNGQGGQKTAFSKWFFYLFYPLHLLMLCLFMRYVPLA